MKETGCQAVKVEGGPTVAETIGYLVQRGIPVMGHVGLQAAGGERGRRASGPRAARRTSGPRVVAEAEATADAGAFCIVVEGVAEALAREITAAVAVPTIGIGASAGCDGQILVTDDMLGLSPRVPKFVKEFGKVGEAMLSA